MTVTSLGARRVALSALMLASIVGCRLPWQQPQPAAAEPMPPIPVYEIAPRVEGETGISLSRAQSRDPIGDLGETKRVSLTAKDADARMLLLWLAQESGVSLVIAPDVTARVSVSFDNVPAAEAIRAIIAKAGLSLLAPGMQSPWPPVVFYHMPVNIKQASAETIVARFGVSLEMAKWIVDSRPKP